MCTKFSVLSCSLLLLISDTKGLSAGAPATNFLSIYGEYIIYVLSFIPQGIESSARNFAVTKFLRLTTLARFRLLTEPCALAVRFPAWNPVATKKPETRSGS